MQQNISKRLLGVEIPSKKCVKYSISKVKGLGYYRSSQICDYFNFTPDMRAYQLDDLTLQKIADYVKSKNWLVEYDLVKKQKSDVTAKIAIQSRLGKRHQQGLPVRSRRTRRNCSTCRKFRIQNHGK
jgi:ribosomal protein S13